ncbi:MAG TPA: CYTH domain-containing protein [Candidatus Portnoybacteria bacterium]|nr:CYTH domain-containing protein [Candidatus Portnoybacteria bacterium]
MVKSQAKNIEVEVRSFISKSQYYNLLKYFKKQGKFLGRDCQITYYFSGKSDLRTQKNKNLAKLWLKGGRIHDNHRKEIEIRFNRKDFDKLEELLITLGYKVEIKWFRTRNDFLWKGTKVAVDYTKGYGYIIELERMVGPRNKNRVYQKLLEQLNQLKINLTPKKEFEQKFRYYKRNWPSLI